MTEVIQDPDSYECPQCAAQTSQDPCPHCGFSDQWPDGYPACPKCGGQCNKDGSCPECGVPPAATPAERRSRVCVDGIRRGAGKPSSPVVDCLTPSCTGKVGGNLGGGRGLCKDCHATASRWVFKKKTSWEELERLGLAQPPYRSLLEKAIHERRKEAEKWKGQTEVGALPPAEEGDKP